MGVVSIKYRDFCFLLKVQRILGLNGFIKLNRLILKAIVKRL